MADPGDLTYKHLSASTNGRPILITGTSAGSPTVVHTATNVSAELDLVKLFLCNTDSSTAYVAGVLVYASSPADPTHVVAKIEIPPNSGAWIALDGHIVNGGNIVAVWCTTGSKITAWGQVGTVTQ